MTSHAVLKNAPSTSATTENTILIFSQIVVKYITATSQTVLISSHATEKKPLSTSPTTENTVFIASHKIIKYGATKSHTAFMISHVLLKICAISAMIC